VPQILVTPPRYEGGRALLPEQGDTSWTLTDCTSNVSCGSWVFVGPSPLTGTSGRVVSTPSKDPDPRIDPKRVDQAPSCDRLPTQ
jgi:hypothetical protein